jgi:hypothetical protein
MGLRGEASKETSRQREKKSEREGGNEREGIIVYRERGENVMGRNGSVGRETVAAV